MSEAETSLEASSLRSSYLSLLEKGGREQKYQDFLERYTKLIPREFVQNHGVALNIILRKLPFGAEYVSDFFFISKSSDDWNLVFIEIEKPSSRFFRKNSNDFHGDFNSALQQIGRWRAWLSIPSNLAHFVDTTISPLVLPQHMRRNPFYPKYILVHGRRSEYGDDVTRRGLVHAQEQSDFKILTFDSLAEALDLKHECYLGVRKNEYIDLLGDRLLSKELLGWINPSEFRVSATLQSAIRKAGDGGVQIRRSGDNGEFVEACNFVADRIRIR